MKQHFKIGKMDYSDLKNPPEKHERATARYFNDRGIDVKFIRPSSIKGTNSPDFEMRGRIWEIKSPTGKSERTYDDDFRKAMKQSKNIIFDLRRLRPSDERTCLKLLYKKKASPELKTLLVITRDGRLLTIKGKFDIM